jgi:hypothetical protein
MASKDLGLIESEHFAYRYVEDLDAEGRMTLLDGALEAGWEFVTRSIDQIPECNHKGEQTGSVRYDEFWIFRRLQ